MGSKVVLVVRCGDGGEALLRLTGAAAVSALAVLEKPAPTSGDDVVVTAPGGLRLWSSTGRPVVVRNLRREVVTGWDRRSTAR